MKVVLGLGANVGDKLAHLSLAFAEIKKIPNTIVKQVSPIYFSNALLPDNAPPEWNLPYLNLCIRCETQLEPLQLLEHCKQIEKAIGREQPHKWGPRIIDIDLLTYDDMMIQSEKLKLPHQHIHERPFVLWPLADVDPLWRFPNGPYTGQTAAEVSDQWGSRFSGSAPFNTRQINQRIDTPQLVGILNITPDSFSDGGKFIESNAALTHALHLVEQGASVLDIGAESTAPNAKILTAEEEWDRLEPILLALQASRDKFLLWPKISVDTRHARTAKKAVGLGIDWINDVTGLQDPAMQEIASSTNKTYVVMHYLSIPADKKHILPRDQDPINIIYEWGKQHLDELEKKGIPRQHIIFDPGIGFGKSPEHSLLLIKNIAQFTGLKTRLLLGYSRKSFLSLFTDKPPHERDIETLAISLCLASQPVDYLRVHDVESCARGFKITSSFK
jgi:2-amino-4-hydroxy-6-hydroxymethyldihydropteridine diphosphokinase / dihydropteroate synthase